ncbi:MAG: iron-sulfur cluster repair di-iron protein [Sphingobacteriaceae bacterium]|nr:iron-sulfur cluster repair di-iron protein [Sphingobacteriaceae bacterium]
MENLLETKVGAVVSKNYRTARIFSAYGIDFCCKGGISVAEACKVNQADAQRVLAELALIIDNEEVADPDAALHQLSNAALIELITTRHHAYVRETAPVLAGYLLKIANVHGQRHPELLPLFAEFRLMHQALLAHLQKEEQVLFPRLKAWEKAMERNPAQAHSLLAPMGDLEEEHSTEGDRLRKMRQLTNDYTLPADACQTYRVAFRMLAEFEEDLHRHIHLENNILFTRHKALFN